MSTPTPDAYDDAVRSRLGGPWRRRHASRPENSPEAVEMRKNRQVNRKIAASGGTASGGADMSFATGRPRDPMFYWKQSGIPFEIDKPDELKRIRAHCRLLYLTHPVIGSCVDIFSKYPLLGLELSCKDEALTEFYTDLFIDERNGLDYESFLIDIGREYWTVGEAWPFAHFNETLGIWENEELLNPDDVDVVRTLFSKDPRFLIKLPETLRNVIQKRSPRWEYDQLMESYPELADYAGPDAKMPVSNVLLRQLKFKGDTFHKRGVPLLMRSLRPVMQEEMLNAAQDAIADRLYTPLVLVKLGASAADLGTSTPWIPTEDDLADFEEALDAALAADFRALVHHFAVDIAPVFGRENMPNMDNDFDRIEARILQTFGLSQTMLSGASGGQTYAADALNRDLVSQLLTTYQRMIKAHYRERAYVVAEAQEHFDYDVRGGRRYVKMEEVLEVDEETGEERIVEQPKLLIPEMDMKSMSMQDENAWHAFVESLVATGVPISMKTRLRNTNVRMEDELETRVEEQVELAVKEQETRKSQFLALRAAGLPIPQDLLADFQPVAANATDNSVTPGRTDTFGLDPTVDTPNIAPSEQDLQALPPAPPGMDGQVPGTVTTSGSPYPAVPPESHEMAATMPKPARRASQRIRAITSGRGHPDDRDEEPENRRPHGMFGDPLHLGARRHLEVDPTVPLDD